MEEEEAEAAAEEEEAEAAGYRIKNKNPTQRCGEKHRYSTIFYLDFDIVGHTLGSKDVKCQQKCWLYLPYVVSLISATTGVLILPHLP